MEAPKITTSYISRYICLKIPQIFDYIHMDVFYTNFLSHFPDEENNLKTKYNEALRILKNEKWINVKGEKFIYKENDIYAFGEEEEVEYKQKMLQKPIAEILSHKMAHYVVHYFKNDEQPIQILKKNVRRDYDIFNILHYFGKSKKVNEVGHLSFSKSDLCGALKFLLSAKQKILQKKRKALKKKRMQLDKKKATAMENLYKTEPFLFEWMNPLIFHEPPLNQCCFPTKMKQKIRWPLPPAKKIENQIIYEEQIEESS